MLNWFSDNNRFFLAGLGLVDSPNKAEEEVPPAMVADRNGISVALIEPEGELVGDRLIRDIMC